MRFVLTIVIVACSTPAKRVEEPPSPSREEAAIAAAPSDASVEVDAPTSETFPWQKIRDKYEAFKLTPVGSAPCDFRVRRPRRPGEPECLPPGGPFVHAAKIRSERPIDQDHSKVIIDLGTDDGVSVGWTAALVDENERVISTWVPVVHVGSYESTVELDVSTTKALHFGRIALRRELK